MTQKLQQQSNMSTSFVNNNSNPPPMPHLAVRLPEIVANIMQFLVPYKSQLDYETMFDKQSEERTYIDIYPCLFVNHLWHDCAVRTMWRRIHFQDSVLCYQAILKLASVLSPAHSANDHNNDRERFSSAAVAMDALAVSKITPTSTMSFDEEQDEEDTDMDDDSMKIDDAEDPNYMNTLSRSTSFSSYVSTSSTLVHTPPNENAANNSNTTHDTDMQLPHKKPPQQGVYSNNTSYFSTIAPISSASQHTHNAQSNRRKAYQSALRTFSVRKIKNPQLNEPLTTIAKSSPKLEQLDIYICDNLTNDTVAQFVSHAYSRLTYISLAGCHLVSDESIVKVAKQCPDLVHLDLRACGLVSDVSLAEVAKNCPRLKHLNVGRVRERGKVTIKSIGLIAQYTEATVLGLAGCDINDDCMMMLAKHRGPGLERLSVNSCYDLSNASIHALLQYCPNLSVFEMKECHRIKDWGAVAEMVQRKVLLTLCDQQNRDCLAWAARHGRQLDIRAPQK